MRTYCAVVIGFIMLMPLAEVRASEATMVASLSITERSASEAHEGIVILPQENDREQLHISWGAATVTIAAHSQSGDTLEQMTSASQPVDFSELLHMEELTVY